ncbi:MAG: NADPH:quinone oxidoreductase family protein [Microbacteriaceae bacterium]|nr:NADPH:quinone oxidoreductase family protein [Microbacteriaceae bacterium]
MKAVQFVSLDGPDAIEIREVEAPLPGPAEALIRVRAAGVAFSDVLRTRGRYQHKPVLPFAPGSEIAGEIVTAPSGSGLEPGDRVIARAGLGGYAELAVAPIDKIWPLPEAVSFETGAAFFANFGTAHFALVERGQLAPGERVLVHGAGGGIGSAAIQIAKTFGASEVIAVVSTAEKGEAALDAGADTYVLAEGFLDAVLALGKVDIVVDTVGGERFDDSLRCLRGDGRLLVVGFASGEIPSVRVNQLLLHNISVVGVGWGSYEGDRAGHTATQWNALLPHLENGRLRPHVGAVFDLDDAAAALQHVEQRRAVGKVLLRP